MNLMSLTAVELGKKIKSGEVRVVDAVNAAFDQIEAVEKDINSYVTVYKKEEVLEKAEHIQKLIDEGQLTGPLAGVPVAIKDNMCTRDKLTTCSSKILGNFYPTYSAEAVINLEKAGAVVGAAGPIITSYFAKASSKAFFISAFVLSAFK